MLPPAVSLDAPQVRKNASMKPLDPRLFRESPAVRSLVILGALWALIQSAGIVLFAWAATSIVVDWFEGRPIDWALASAAVIAGAGLRAFASWGASVTAARAAARAKNELRERGMAAIAEPGAHLGAGHGRADTTVLFSQGLDRLDDYFGSFVPQLLTAAISTPLLWLAILWADLPSAVTIAIVLPLIPLFMVLIGLATRSVQDTQWRSLQSLARQFLDLVDGVSTLKIFRRERAQVPAIEAAGEEYRVRTMRVLRLSFLSGFTLELAATLSVALVAVLIGTRLIAGDIDLRFGLFVLLLVPDVFAPLRQVGASFHAASDGRAAAEDLFAVLDAATPASSRAGRPVVASDVSAPGVHLRHVTVRRADRVIISGLDADFAPGHIHAIVGPSGAGKSTLLAGILGFAELDGECAIDGSADTRSRVAWVPQRASLRSGTIAENVALGEDTPDMALVRDCLARAAAADLPPDQMLGAGGTGLSGGQAQRVSIARALYRLASNSHVNTLLLDEPSSALDGATQERVRAELRRLAGAGVCVVMVSHRDELVDDADTLTRIGGES